MKIKDSVAFVTGANRGLGLAVVNELLARGAKKVYAGVRNPASINIPGVVAVKLDVTNPDDVAAAAALCSDTTLLVNNAGIVQLGGFQGERAMDDARAIFETNFFALIRIGQSFGPILKQNGGGAIVNILSVASWFNSAQMAAYAASKSAAWSYTNALRNELLEQGTQVVGLHVGFMDTDMTKGFDLAKASPVDVARQTLDGVEAGLSEVLADDVTHMVKQGLTASPGLYLAPLQR